jgi:hypothetical protein
MSCSQSSSVDETARCGPDRPTLGTLATLLDADFPTQHCFLEHDLALIDKDYGVIIIMIIIE